MDEQQQKLINSAATLSLRNREALAKFTDCGCYQCLRTFETKEIIEWTDSGQTAICPHCSIDAIVPGVTNIEVLTQMSMKWFCAASRARLQPQ